MIVIVFPQLYGVHGIARYLQSFLAAANDGSVRIVVLAGDDDVRPLVTASNVEFVHLPLPAGRFGLIAWSLAARRWLIDAARTEKIESINVHIPPLLPGLFMPPVARIVVTAHTTYLGMSGQFDQPQQFRSQWGPLSVFVKKLFERLIFARADTIVTLTEQGRQEVLRYGYKRAIEIVPNGVDLEAFISDCAVEKVYDVVFAGRIERRKGSRPMVNVCRGLVQKKSDIRICIVGYGDDFEYVSAELGPLTANIELAGKIPFEGMLEKYRKSRIYASTSYYEGLPGTCLEAMAVGLPVVVWDYLFYRDLVKEGTNGRLIPPNNIDSFILGITELLESPKRLEAMGENARDRVVNSFSWHGIANGLLKILKRTRGTA